VKQASLFEPTEGLLVLADDERGRIDYRPGFVAASVAEAWFAELRTTVNWNAQRRRMYDRDVDVPRLTAHFALEPPGADADAPPAPPAVLAAGRRVREAIGVPFNSVGLNLYRDGRDSVAPHNDHLYEIAEGFPIALLSLGAPRRMTIRAKAAPRRVIHRDLEAGSLLLMSHATQLHYTHGIPKVAGPVGERISLAFRVRPSPGSATARGRRGIYR